MSRLPLRFMHAACLLMASGAAFAAGDDIAACMVPAWSADKSPEGVDIRSGPGTESPVIGNLPPPLRVAEGYEFAAEVSITGSEEGWLRIDRAILNNYISDDEPEIVFEGEGWVSGDQLGLAVEGRYLRGAPSHDAPPVKDFYERLADGGVDLFQVERLHACQGFWVDVEGSYDGHRLRGWTDDTCASQVTTCP